MNTNVSRKNMFFMKLRKLNLMPSLTKLFENVRFHIQADETELKAVHMAFKTYDCTSNDADAGFPLIIMHGLFGSKRNWNSLSKVLCQKTVPPRKIIAVDCRNHGNSPHTNEHSYPHLAEDIKVLVEKQLDIEKVALLGHSMGGRAMMYFALKYVRMQRIKHNVV